MVTELYDSGSIPCPRVNCFATGLLNNMKFKFKFNKSKLPS